MPEPRTLAELLAERGLTMPRPMGWYRAIDDGSLLTGYLLSPAEIAVLVAATPPPDTLPTRDLVSRVVKLTPIPMNQNYVNGFVDARDGIVSLILELTGDKE